MPDRRRNPGNPFTRPRDNWLPLVVVLAVLIALTLATPRAAAGEVTYLTPTRVAVTGETTHREIQIRIVDAEGYLLAARRIAVKADGSYERELDLAGRIVRGALEVIERPISNETEH